MNRTFCRDTTPLLFRHIFGTSRKGLARLYLISYSPLAGYVQHINIGNASHPDNLAIGTPYASGFDDLLFRCLVRLPNLRSLDFAGGRLYCSVTNDSLIYSLRNCLLYMNSPALRELNIAYPVTYNFGRFLSSQLLHANRRPTQVSVPRIFRRLRHLGLQVQGWTRQPPGHRYREEARTWGYIDMFPNPRYLGCMTILLRLAENLQSLALTCTEALDIVPLVIPDSWHLRSLSLTRVSFSAEEMGDLVHQSHDSLESVELSECELTAGSTWEEVLGKLRELPRLTSFQMEQCGYATTDASTGPALDQIMRRDGQPIETQHVEDWAALGRLKFHVNANRVASGLRPRTWRL